ncbi:hypothetical protein NP233_g2135 [Leucocoprinus birnbaumii]|uniref:Uncharacterized protein n=1 Tax=Leucocoprinus birnbaumii TaxID=56174 RepID=A0AAD5VYS3_9AGAR|nr:hypothetical protein NP233_g2135 [Leucocoprinus birnbaumii]
MATVLDAPSALGTYMLRGWVLTDRPCPTRGCRIPLLRSPVGQDPVVHLCVSCDESSNTSRPSPTAPADGAPPADASTSNSTSSASHLTRASTPATEVSDVTDDLPPFVESEETRRRREKTDLASAEIGRRLLQGWTMLGDECPRDECYYVPLVRPPKKAGEPDPKKECVLCGNFYTTERDQVGREILVPVEIQTTAQTTGPSSLARSDPIPATFSVDHQSAAVTDNSAKKPAAPNPPKQVRSALTVNLVWSLTMHLEAGNHEHTRYFLAALQLSLQTLTARLTSLSSNPTFVDPASIATTADAITKVTQAISQVKQLQWSETQARTMS